MSDANGGLTQALLLDGCGGASQVDWSGVQNWSPEQGLLWVHLNFEQARAAQWIEQHSGLNDIARTALLSDQTRPRAISRGDNLLLALRGVNLNPGQDPEDMVSIRIWTNGKLIVSTHRRNLLAVQDIVEKLESGSGPTTAAAWIVDLNDLLLQRMSDTVANLEDSMMLLEESVLAGNTHGLRHELALLRNQSLGIRRFLSPQREAVNRLALERLTWMDELNTLRLREVTDRLVRYIEDIDIVRERAAMTQDELMSALSEQMNARTYVLTIVAALFLPLGFFTGLMGINVGGMPGMEDNMAFWIVVAICLGITGLLGVMFYLKKWL
ncbi:MAG: zinc transporter ZntB [Halioglobus sp.]